MVKKVKNSKKAKQNSIITAICWPFQKIASAIRSVWNWIAGINMVALLNVALLVSIIVLFSLLIVDLRKSANANDSEIVMQNPVISTPVTPEPITPTVKPRPRKTTKLPIKRDINTRKPIATPIQVAHVTENPVAVSQIAKQNNSAYGDVIIDHYDMRNVLPNKAHVHGNLYIQNLRKYTLPCNIVIDGNLILRDVNMLNFCGDFIVRGNIYVSTRSSFRLVPKTARIGGRVIL